MLYEFYDIFSNRNNGLFSDDLIYNKLNEILTDTELIFRIKNWLSSTCVEVVEQAWITIGYFVNNGLEISDKLTECKIIEQLLDLLGPSQTLSINQAWLWSIFNLWK